MSGFFDRRQSCPPLAPVRADFLHAHLRFAGFRPSRARSSVAPYMWRQHFRAASLRLRLPVRLLFETLAYSLYINVSCQELPLPPAYPSLLSPRLPAPGAGNQPETARSAAALSFPSCFPALPKAGQNGRRGITDFQSERHFRFGADSPAFPAAPSPAGRLAAVGAITPPHPPPPPEFACRGRRKRDRNRPQYGIAYRMAIFGGCLGYLRRCLDARHF